MLGAGEAIPEIAEGRLLWVMTDLLGKSTPAVNGCETGTDCVLQALPELMLK
jgi:hypothetical protein